MNDPKTLRAIRGESDLRNKRHEMTRKQGFFEYFSKMKIEGNAALKAKAPSDVWESIYLDWSTRFGLDTKTLRLIWQTAKRTGEVGELIEHCITGVGVAKPKQFKNATSNTYFSAMAMIPDQRCIEL